MGSHNTVKKFNPDFFKSSLVAAAFVLTAFVYLRTALDFSFARIYFDHNNLFFGADHVEAFQGWVLYHKGVHPLLLLFVLPLTFLFRYFTRNPVYACLFVNVTFGMIGCALAFIALRKHSGLLIPSLLATLFFAVTGSQWIFSAVPDSFSLGAASVIGSFVLLIFCLKDEKLYFFWWVVAGLFSFGVTITNFGVTIFCFVTALVAVHAKRKLLLALIFIIAVFGVGTILNFIQYSSYPGSKLWYDTKEYAHERKYMDFDGFFHHPFTVGAEAFRNVFVFNVVLGKPEKVVIKNEGSDWSYYQHFRMLSFWGVLSVVLWLAVLGCGIYSKISGGLESPLIWACSLCILWNLGIHVIYGVKEIFLYTGHFTFPVVLLSLPDGKTLWKRNLILCLLLLLVGLNNMSVINWIASETSRW